MRLALKEGIREIIIAEDEATLRCILFDRMREQFSWDEQGEFV